MSFPPSEPRQDRPLPKAAAIISATILIVGSSLFQPESSRRPEMSGECAETEAVPVRSPATKRIAPRMFLLHSQSFAIVRQWSTLPRE